MSANRFWTAEIEARLVDLANAGVPATDIATALGCNRSQVFNKASRMGVTVARWTPAEAEEMEIKQRAHANRYRPERRKTAPGVIHAPRGVAKTSAEYRRLLPPAPEMTKGELRRLLHTAVLNTEGARL